AGDAFSYEHDVYFGYSGEAGGIGYDVGYLYFNYDANAEFDFSEVYGSLSFGAFTVGAQILADTEAAEGVGQDFGFGQATYIYGDYAIELANEAELSFHVGRHAGDFVEAFNGTTDDYLDYGVTLAKDGFAFTISGTTLGSDDNNDGEEDYASMSARDNDNIKFVLSYSVDFAL
ncbi:TorF family putative porin, partial [Gammaproteobacteria bacterium]|nr:TorF family putative porin [Gammaproteobacteria bacterium]